MRTAEQKSFVAPDRAPLRTTSPWKPRWLVELARARETPSPPPAPSPDPSPFSPWPPRPADLAHWPDAWWERWGLRANELEASGLGWREAERQAYTELKGRNPPPALVEYLA